MEKNLTAAVELLAEAGRMVDAAWRAREIDAGTHRDATIAVSNARSDVIRLTGWKRAEVESRPATAATFAHVCCGCGARIKAKGPVADGDRVICGACGTPLIVLNPEKPAESWPRVNR